MQLGGYFDEPEVAELHRAIGAFTTTFSEMLTQMKHAIVSYFEDDAFRVLGPRVRLFDAMFATMTAKPIADAFFASTRLVGNFDTGDETILKTIRKAVTDQLEFRNDVSHADWAVGWQTHPTGDKLPPTAHKIKSVGGIPTSRDLGITMGQFAERIQVQAALPSTISVVGRLAKMRQEGNSELLADRLQLFRLPGTDITLYRPREGDA